MRLPVDTSRLGLIFGRCRDFLAAPGRDAWSGPSTPGADKPERADNRVYSNESGGRSSLAGALHQPTLASLCARFGGQPLDPARRG
jgi:hypothetical protein